MDTLIGLAVQAALFVAAIKLFLWARKLKSASRTRWRRRVGLLFFLAPLLAILGRMFLPEWAQLPIAFLIWINARLESLLLLLLGVAQENASGIWLIALKPLCYAAVYGSAGFLIGWPLDRLAAKRAAAKGQTSDDELPQDDGWRG